jgi:lysyl-tRNA synthetase class 1
MLLNLASVINADNPAMLWGFLHRYAPDITAESHPLVARLIERAVAYYRDRVAPEKRHRAATPAEAEAMRDLAAALRERATDLEQMPPEERAKAIQDLVYDAGRREPFLQPAKEGGRPGVSRAWFDALYQVLLGQPEGPRFGGFVALYGIAGTIGLIEGALARDAGAA